uniref:YLP motif-containing protein 1 isoform X2 n=1 Tax=Ciona intestinalis TaxID=7719 RepID=UPI000EF49B74|nr:YLP motif-containing protein 1 isoform X2 [Ciona intestinalis]|eukprot:XP_026695911.1 YLP motif-containing protein 1 isoform X2 [Ciona intestinalis]
MKRVQQTRMSMPNMYNQQQYSGHSTINNRPPPPMRPPNYVRQFTQRGFLCNQFNHVRGPMNYTLPAPLPPNHPTQPPLPPNRSLGPFIPPAPYHMPHPPPPHFQPPPPPQEDKVPIHIEAKPPPPSTTEKWWLSELQSMKDTDPLKFQLQKLIQEDWFIGLSTIQQIECWQHKMELKSQKLNQDTNKLHSKNLEKLDKSSKTKTTEILPDIENKVQSIECLSQQDVEIPKWELTLGEDVCATRQQFKIHYEKLVKKAEVFNEQYKEWQKQFHDWKNRHKTHPNQAQFFQYESQWKHWEEEMLKQTNSNKANMERLQYNISAINKHIEDQEAKQKPNMCHERYEAKEEKTVLIPPPFKPPIMSPSNSCKQKNEPENPNWNNFSKASNTNIVRPFHTNSFKHEQSQNYSTVHSSKNKRLSNPGHQFSKVSTEIYHSRHPSPAPLHSRKRVQRFPFHNHTRTSHLQQDNKTLRGTSLPHSQNYIPSTNIQHTNTFPEHNQLSKGQNWAPDNPSRHRDLQTTSQASQQLATDALLSETNLQKLKFQLASIIPAQDDKTKSLPGTLINTETEKSDIKSAVFEKAKELSTEDLNNLLSAVHTVSQNSNSKYDEHHANPRNMGENLSISASSNSINIQSLGDNDTSYDQLLEKYLKMDPDLERELVLRTMRDNMLMEEAKAIDPTYLEDLNSSSLNYEQEIPDPTEMGRQSSGFYSPHFPRDILHQEDGYKKGQSLAMDYENEDFPRYDKAQNIGFTRRNERNISPRFYNQNKSHDEFNERKRDNEYGENSNIHNFTGFNNRTPKTNEKNRSFNSWRRDIDTANCTFKQKTSAPKLCRPVSRTSAEDILCLPGRLSRPKKIAVILRGLPGSGKTYVAKVLRDKENEHNISSRVLSLDDYFITESEKSVKDPDTGKMVKQKIFEYEHEPEMEQTYRASLLKSFKKTLDDGFFTFVILDSINEKVEHFFEFYQAAEQHGFNVFVAELQSDVDVCFNRNVHKRTRKEIEALQSVWQETPPDLKQLDLSFFIKNSQITEVNMEDASDTEGDIMKTNLSPVDQQLVEVPKSKWENESATAKLDQLDGIKKSVAIKRSMEDFLSVTDDYNSRHSAPGKKRVRWADIDAEESQKRMREVGFVVGQTNWTKMMDKGQGQKALNQTKLF